MSYLNSPSITDVIVKDINLKEVKLSDYQGKVLLIVNVASKCMYTQQYKNLQSLYEKFKEQDFEVLAFPCNDFGHQEPGTNEEILNFCLLNYDVRFTIFDKIHVNGNEQSPLYGILTNNPVTGKSPVEWNFEKFIIDKKGKIVKRYRSSTEPDSDEITTIIQREINK